MTTQLDLSGDWQIKLGDAAWESRMIHLPGSLQSQGFGPLPSATQTWMLDPQYAPGWDPRFREWETGANPKFVPFLTPERHYVGPATYERDVVIPHDWQGKHIELTLERPHWFTTVTVDGQEVGKGDRLGVPHRFDLSRSLSAGKHRLRLEVDNSLRVDVGVNAHSVSDHTQSNWNGVVGEVRLDAKPSTFVESLQVHPFVSTKSVQVNARIQGAQTGGTVTARVLAKDGNTWKPIGKEIAVAESPSCEMLIPLGANAKLWDEFAPNLYRVDVTVHTARGEDTKSTTFGLRQITTTNRRILVNGRPISLRGTLECAIFPDTGYPPTKIEPWRRILKIVKAHGLNHIRFHSWCPPEAAFQAADELGVYFQVEASCWADFGGGRPVEKWVTEEGDAILREFANHPSFVFMSPTNEPAGKANDFLNALTKHWKETESRVLFTAGTGWPQVSESQYHVTNAPRLNASANYNLSITPNTVGDYRKELKDFTVPVVSHEIGQIPVYPDLNERAKFKGTLQAKNFEVIGDIMARHGLRDQDEAFHLASGAFQAALYKYEIESLLRTRDLAGFQVLDLHDFPGQGYAPVGVLDPFWNSRRYIDAAAYKRFAGDIVLLAKFSKFIWHAGDRFEATVDVSQFGPKNLANAQVKVELRDAKGKVVRRTETGFANLPTGQVSTLGVVQLDLHGLAAPARYTLRAELEGTKIWNDWPLWIYPRELANEPSNVIVTDDVDKALAACANGGRVLFTPKPASVNSQTYGCFRPIFWDRYMFRGREHTVGFVCEANHPAFAQFPTESHPNWQWHDILEHSKPIVLDSLGQKVKPILQPIDDWNDCRKLGLLFEAKIGSGRLLICSVDLQANLNDRPAAKQLRSSLLAYAAGDRFQPASELTEAEIRSLIRPMPLLTQWGATAWADAENADYPASNAIDGDPATFWHTPWGDPKPKLPHSLTLDLGKAHTLSGLQVLPRQDMNHGRIGRYRIEAGSAKDRIDQVIAEGQWVDSREMQVVRFKAPVTARFFRIVALEDLGGDVFTTIAEVNVLTEKP